MSSRDKLLLSVSNIVLTLFDKELSNASGHEKIHLQKIRSEFIDSQNQLNSYNKNNREYLSDETRDTLLVVMCGLLTDLCIKENACSNKVIEYSRKELSRANMEMISNMSEYDDNNN